MIFKTDWKYGDIFNLAPDYIRIKGNIEAVKAKAAQLYKLFYTPKLQNQMMFDIPNEIFFNSIEQSVEIIANKTFRREGFQDARLYFPNAAIWTFDDLNRIESNLQTLWADLISAEQNRQILALSLGGVVLGGVSYA